METVEIIKIYILGFGSSFIIQFVFQKWFGKNSYWQHNIGWQNEIAIWNIGICIILYGLIKNSVSDVFEISLGLFVMSFLFCINHVAALLKNKLYLSNIMGALINLFGMILLVMK